MFTVVTASWLDIGSKRRPLESGTAANWLVSPLLVSSLRTSPLPGFETSKVVGEMKTRSAGSFRAPPWRTVLCSLRSLSSIVRRLNVAETVKRLSFLAMQSDSEAAAKGVRGSKGLEQLPSQLVAPVTTLKFPGEQGVHTDSSVSELEEERVEQWKVGRGLVG